MSELSLFLAGAFVSLICLFAIGFYFFYGAFYHAAQQGYEINASKFKNDGK